MEPCSAPSLTAVSNNPCGCSAQRAEQTVFEYRPILEREAGHERALRPEHGMSFDPMPHASGDAPIFMLSLGWAVFAVFVLLSRRRPYVLTLGLAGLSSSPVLVRPRPGVSAIATWTTASPACETT
jgi:hypothetical protein